MFVLALLTYIDHHDKKIKTPLNLITLEELLSSVHRKKIILATTLKAGCTGDLRVSFFFT
ncbi:hypothetical protein [Lactobacillus helveticus]|nr:hypothetical protein [Lactobacillus helveticus]